MQSLSPEMIVHTIILTCQTEPITMHGPRASRTHVLLLKNGIPFRYATDWGDGTDALAPASLDTTTKWQTKD